MTDPTSTPFTSAMEELHRWAGPPLHERIEQYLEEFKSNTGCPGYPWAADLRVSTPGETRDYWAGTVTDFELTVDGDLEERDDLLDAARMYLESMSHRDVDVDGAGADAGDVDERDEVDWEAMADDVVKHYDDPFPDVVRLHESVFPGDARSLAEAEALVGTHPKHETLEEMPGPCILCGEDEVHVTVERNPDGEIEETKLKCHECGWRVTGGPLRFEEKHRLDERGQA